MILFIVMFMESTTAALDTLRNFTNTFSSLPWQSYLFTFSAVYSTFYGCLCQELESYQGNSKNDLTLGHLTRDI